MSSSDLVMVGSYDYRLVALSVVIAILASYPALDLGGRVTNARGGARLAWLIGGATAMGIGIWSMHFVGMLAFILPVPVHYDWPTVLLSLLAAILASVGALFVVSRRKMGPVRAWAGSIFAGGGIAAMHYTAMASMRMQAMCHYSPALVTLSVVLAVLISLLSLWLTFVFRDEATGWRMRKVAGATVMGMAIPVMHYTGMAAASFTPTPAVPNLSHAVSISALGIAGIGVVIQMAITIALLTSLADRLAARKQVLDSFFAASPVGLAVLDNQLRFLEVNQTLAEFHGLPVAEHLGRTLRQVLPQITSKVEPLLRRVLATGKPAVNVEISGEVSGRPGVLRHWVKSYYPIVGETGFPVAVGAVVVEITERKRAEERPREYEKAVEGLEEMIVVVDREYRCLLANRAFLKYRGLEREQLVGRLIPELLGEEVFEKAAKGKLDECLQGKVVKYEVRYHYPRLGERDLFVSYFPIEGPAGVDRIACILQDITERKRAEEIRTAQVVQAEVHAEVSIAFAQETSLESILQRCAEAMVRHLDAAFARIWILNEKENALELRASAGMYTHLNGPHGRVQVGTLEVGLMVLDRESHLTNDVASDPRISDKTWAVREGMVAFAGYPLIVEGRVVGVMAMFARRPLTQVTFDALASVADTMAQGIGRKQTQEELRRSEERWRAIFENSAVGIALTDRQDAIFVTNRAFREMVGYTDDELRALTFMDITYEEDRERSLLLREELWEGKRQQYVYEKRYRRKDGKLIWVRNTVSPAPGGEAVPQFVMAISEDITAQKQAEEELREQKNRAQMFFDVAGVMLLVLNPDQTVALINLKGAEILGYEREEIIGKHWCENFVPARERHWLSLAFAKLIEGEAAPVEYVENPVLRKSGEERIIAWHNTVFRDESGKIVGTLSSGEDITERKRAAEELQRSRDQLRALAARVQKVREEERTHVAREIHDELGQALTAIKIDLSSLSHELPADKKQQAEFVMKLVDETIQTVRRISTELRPVILDAVGLAAAVEWAADEFETRTGIKCRLDLPQDEIVIDQERATALFRIFQETLTNVARHADATEVNVRLAKGDGSLLLDLQDNGKGISEEQASAGSSLGILGMRERAFLLGGELTIRGAPGKGTTVNVRLPLGQPEHAGEPE